MILYSPPKDLFPFVLQMQSLADPFAYDAYIEQRKKEKVEAERASRITVCLSPLCIYDSSKCPNLKAVSFWL